MLLSQLQRLFARDTVLLFQYIHEEGYSFTYGETMRTPEQAEIYMKSGKGIKDSLHCKRLAIDINLFNEKDEYLDDPKHYEKFACFWEHLSPSNRAGYNFKSRPDANHFERNDRPSK